MKKKQIVLSLGGLRVLMQSDDKSIIELIRDAFRGFVSASGRPEIRITIHVDKRMGDIQPYAYGNPHRTSVHADSGVILARGSVFSGMVNVDELTAEVRHGVAIEPVYLFLRFVLSAFLPLFDGFLMHAASIVRDRDCFLFAGQPQSGKSTLVKMSSNYTVLSDDFSIVRRMNDCFCCFASPFWGHVQTKGGNMKMGCAYVAIRATYFLKQDDEAYIRRLDAKQQCLRLMQNICLIAKDSRINTEILKLADECSKEVGGGILHFKLDNSFWRCIEDDRYVCKTK